MRDKLFGPTRFDPSDANYESKEDCRECGPVHEYPAQPGVPLLPEIEPAGVFLNQPDNHGEAQSDRLYAHERQETSPHAV